MTSSQPPVMSFNAFGIESWAKDSYNNIVGSVPLLGAVTGARRISRAVHAMKTFDKEAANHYLTRMEMSANIMSHIFRGVLEILGVGVLASIYDLASLIISVVVTTIAYSILGVIVAIGNIIKALLVSLCMPVNFVAVGLHELFSQTP
ncbi:hypothetical protein [Chlamydiifrater phoenicopteri]|uniref:hypothetical protein n=1 Tax=Chlamydiifrater phoenicopteri TaxID=2681469 RepID=UPI001BCBB037|nr:hypothetical protein [Chlamydiifrater phoenicopteri]